MTFLAGTLFRATRSRSLPHRLKCLLLFALLAPTLRAQDHPDPIASATPTESSEVPRVPGISGLLRGLNGGLTISGLHDAQSGWATVAQPAIGYSFNDIFSFDITVPIYMYRLAASRARNPPANAFLVNQRAEPGDVLFSLHAQFIPRSFEYLATISATAPTGDTPYGVSTGHPTFDFSNRFDHPFAHVTPNVEIGVGDASSIINPLVTRDLTSLGPLAHFQAGVSLPLFWGASFETGAYEQLPIGDQKVYRSVIRRGSPTVIVSGRSVTEDNGFINSLDIPLDGHTTLSAFYSRSLRFQDDVVSFGITYVLRGFKSAKEKSRDDQLLRAVQQELGHTDAPIPAAVKPVPHP